MGRRGGGQVGLGEAVEDAAALAGQRLEQLQVLGAQAGAVAVEARRERAAALEAGHQRRRRPARPR